MLVRRLLAAVTAGLTVAGLGIVAAAPVSAATFIVDPSTCAARGGVVDGSRCVFEGETEVLEGDVWVIDGIDLWNQDSSLFTNNGGIAVSGGWVIVNVTGSSFVNNGQISLADGSSLFNSNANSTFTNNGMITYCTAVIDAVVGGNPPTLTCPDPGVSAAAAATIPAWVQAYGRPGADAPCPAGWDPSWDQWPNGGQGGFVCQRSIPSIG